MKRQAKNIINFYDLIDNPNWKKAVIVYDKSNWQEEYDINARSYLIVNDSSFNKVLSSGKISSSLLGSSLDGKDKNVRLDMYNWKKEYCYILE